MSTMSINTECGDLENMTRSIEERNLSILSVKGDLDSSFNSTMLDDSLFHDDEAPMVLPHKLRGPSMLSEFSVHGDFDDMKSSRSSAIASLVASIVNSVRKLKKSIGCFQGFSLLVGIIVGSGIFISPSLVLNDVKDVGVSLVIWFGCGLLALLGSLCYCELGTTIKKAGGNYAFILFTYGPVPAFLCSWTQALIIDPTIVSVISLTFGTYIMRPFNEMIEPNPWYGKAVAAACIILAGTTNCLSVKASTALQTVFTACQILSILFFVVLGCWQLGTDHFNNFHHMFEKAEIGWNTIGSYGAAFFGVLWAYNGWQMVVNITEDMINVERNLFLTVVTAVPFVMVSYLAVNVAFLTVLTPEQVGCSKAVGVEFVHTLLGKKVAYIVPVLVALSCYGSVNGCVFACGRISLAAGREGHMPEILGMIHRSRHTPIPAVLLTSILALIMLLPDANNLTTLINFASISTWFIILIAIFGVIVLRVRQPDLHRPFKVWLIAPIIMSVVALFLVIVPFAERPVNSAVAIGIILLGLPVYFLLVHMASRHPPWFINFCNTLTGFLKERMNLAPCTM